MEDSILKSVRKNIGLGEDNTDFDSDLIDHINSVFDILYQVGIGPRKRFYIEDDSTTWDEYLPNGGPYSVKSYIYLKVRMMFDPPSNSSLYAEIDKRIDEFEWRLSIDSSVE